jgi:hypothetical protein
MRGSVCVSMSHVFTLVFVYVYRPCIYTCTRCREYRIAHVPVYSQNMLAIGHSLLDIGKQNPLHTSMGSLDTDVTRVQDSFMVPRTEDVRPVYTACASCSAHVMA